MIINTEEILKLLKDVEEYITKDVSEANMGDHQLDCDSESCILCDVRKKIVEIEKSLKEPMDELEKVLGRRHQIIGNGHNLNSVSYGVRQVIAKLICSKLQDIQLHAVWWSPVAIERGLHLSSVQHDLQSYFGITLEQDRVIQSKQVIDLIKYIIEVIEEQYKDTVNNNDVDHFHTVLKGENTKLECKGKITRTAPGHFRCEECKLKFTFADVIRDR